MALKPLRTSEDIVVRSNAQWEKQQEDIKRRPFGTIGVPPVERSTRMIEVISSSPWAGKTWRIQNPPLMFCLRWMRWIATGSA